MLSPVLFAPQGVWCRWNGCSIERRDARSSGLREATASRLHEARGQMAELSQAGSSVDEVAASADSKTKSEDTQHIERLRSRE